MFILKDPINQGLLYTWTGQLWQKFENLKLVEISKSYWYHMYILESYKLLQSLEAVAQKMSPPCPFQFLTSQERGCLNYHIPTILKKLIFFVPSGPHDAQIVHHGGHSEWKKSVSMALSEYC